MCQSDAAPAAATGGGPSRPMLGHGSSAATTSAAASVSHQLAPWQPHQTVEARQAPAQCTPHDRSDVSVFDCQTFCSATYRDAHCDLCKVRALACACACARVPCVASRDAHYSLKVAHIIVSHAHAHALSRAL